MAVGDRAPEGSYVTGTENGCTWRSDGHLYNAYGYQVETEAEKRARREEERKINEARRQASDPSFGQIVDEEFEKMGSEITNAFHETNNQIAKGIIGAVGIGAVIAGAAKYSSETKKCPADSTNAMRKAGRNALCVIGISVIIIVLCIVALAFLLLDLNEIASIVVGVFILMGEYSIYGLIRVMCDKTFFIHFKKPLK